MSLSFNFRFSVLLRGTACLMDGSGARWSKRMVSPEERRRLLAGQPILFAGNLVAQLELPETAAGLRENPDLLDNLIRSLSTATHRACSLQASPQAPAPREDSSRCPTCGHVCEGEEAGRESAAVGAAGGPPLALAGESAPSLQDVPPGTSAASPAPEPASASQRVPNPHSRLPNTIYDVANDWQTKRQARHAGVRHKHRRRS